MENIPETVQWLLDFANLNSKTGKLQPHKLITQIIIKHPPIEYPPLEKKAMIVPDFVQGGHEQISHGGYMWFRQGDKTTFEGREEDNYPTKKMFNNFFSRTGIIIKSKYESEYDCIKNIWNMAGHSLLCKLDTAKKSEYISEYVYCVLTAEFFVYDHYSIKEIPLPEPPHSFPPKPGFLSNGLKFPHDSTLTQVLCASILDFWCNRKELHSRLKQCNCCGMFWIQQEKKKRGRKRTFCSEKCNVVFHMQSRQNNLINVKTKRKYLKKESQNNDYLQLFEWLKDKEEYSPDDAKKKAHDWVYVNGKSFKEYKRTIAKSFGIED